MRRGDILEAVALTDIRHSQDQEGSDRFFAILTHFTAKEILQSLKFAGVELVKIGTPNSKNRVTLYLNTSILQTELKEIELWTED
jgi:hypothetical protein